MTSALSWLAAEADRWRALAPGARRYLLSVALLTAGLAAPGLLFNLAVLALGHPRSFLGTLNTVTFGVAAALSLPLWLSVGRLGLRRALVASALLHAASALIVAARPDPAPLVLSAALAGLASVLAQVSAAPFMMRHSDDATRAHLFSAASAVAVGVGGVATLLAGALPGWLGAALGASPESALAYRACYALSGVVIALAALPLVRARDAGRGMGDGGARITSATSHPTSRIPHPVSLPAPLRELLRRPRPLLRLLIPPFLISWGAALLIPYLNLFYAERFGVASMALGVIFAGFDLATGAALLLAPLLAGRFGMVGAVVLTRALALPFTLLMGFAPALWLSAAAALARVTLFNMAAPLYDAFAMQRTEDPARPFVVGMLGGAYSAGYLLAPAISTAVQERYGFAPLFVATTVLYALSVFLTWRWFARSRRQDDGP